MPAGKRNLLHLKLLKLLLLEEYRLNTSMIGRVQFMFFPVFIVIFACIISIISPTVLRAMPIDKVYLILHGVLIAYGIGVGGFALFAEHIAERRFGQVNLLLETPQTLPVEFRTLFMVFYIKDIIYYLLFSIIPLIAGILISVPITHFHITGIFFLLFTATLSFILGISFSFIMSSVYVRWRAAFGVMVVALAVAFVVPFVNHAYSVRLLLPSLMFQYTGNLIYLTITVAAIIIFSASAVKFIKIEPSKKAERYAPEIYETGKQFRFARKYSIFASKEWIDIKRSRTLGPIMFAYVGPMAFLAAVQWFLKSVLALPISFNIVFYAGLIGFFSITIYSWFNVTDTPEFYQTLPVTVPQIVKTKLVLLAFFTYTIAGSFLVLIAILESELQLLPLAIMVAFINTTYTALITAYLTGLRTNTYMFNPAILARFALLIIPPLITITISAFLLDLDFQVYSTVVVIVCLIQAVVIITLPRRISKKWAKSSFTL